jgi:hypothetical protein
MLANAEAKIAHRRECSRCDPTTLVPACPQGERLVAQRRELNAENLERSRVDHARYAAPYAAQKAGRVK